MIGDPGASIAVLMEKKIEFQDVEGNHLVDKSHSFNGAKAKSLYMSPSENVSSTFRDYFIHTPHCFGMFTLWRKRHGHVGSSPIALIGKAKKHRAVSHNATNTFGEDEFAN